MMREELSATTHVFMSLLEGRRGREVDCASGADGGVSRRGPSSITRKSRCLIMLMVIYTTSGSESVDVFAKWPQ